MQLVSEWGDLICCQEFYRAGGCFGEEGLRHIFPRLTSLPVYVEDGAIAINVDVDSY